MALSIPGWMAGDPFRGLLPERLIGVRAPGLTTDCNTTTPLHKGKRDPQSQLLSRCLRHGIAPSTEFYGQSSASFSVVLAAFLPGRPQPRRRLVTLGGGTHAALPPPGDVACRVLEISARRLRPELFWREPHGRTETFCAENMAGSSVLCAAGARGKIGAG